MTKRMKLSLQDLSYLMVFMIMIIFIITSGHTSPSPKFDKVIEVEVHEGDTLWSIAKVYSYEIPVQTFIGHIKVHNELQHDFIYPGQKLLVPLGEKHKVVKDEGDYLLSSKY